MASYEIFPWKRIYVADQAVYSTHKYYCEVCGPAHVLTDPVNIFCHYCPFAAHSACIGITVQSGAKYSCGICVDMMSKSKSKSVQHANDTRTSSRKCASRAAARIQIQAAECEVPEYLRFKTDYLGDVFGTGRTFIKK